MEGSLEDIRLFHTDRGNEFKNQTIEELLETFHIERSLSHKGCPYDNAVEEATFKIIKTEFIWNETFTNLSELKLKLWDYVHWYNHYRIHSSLGYQTPVEYRENNLKKVSFTVIRKYLQQLINNADKQGASKSREHITSISGRLSAFLLRNRTPFLRVDI